MVKLVAVLCSLSAPYACHDETVPASTSLQLCQIGVRVLAEWMNERPQYRLAGWKCQMGSKAMEREA